MKKLRTFMINEGEPNSQVENFFQSNKVEDWRVTQVISEGVIITTYHILIDV